MLYIIIYVIIIFILGLLVELKKIHPSIYNNPYVYALSFSVLATGWTYFGNVEKAAYNDPYFLGVLPGVVISAIFYPIILKKLIFIKNKYRITSIADLLSLRYNKSTIVGILVTVICFIAIIPYISLQFQAIFSSLSIITKINSYIELIIIAIITLFVIGLGIRKLDPTEHHRGIIFVVAIEGVVKFLAVIILTFFIFFKYNSGILDFFQKVNHILPPSFPPPKSYFYSNWMTLTILTFFATLLLPRQFHISVVENNDISHINTAMWLFPLYFFLIIVPAFFIAWQGLLDNLPLNHAKDFNILIPYFKGDPYLGIFIFIGGLSACIGMITLSTIAVTTMISNQIILPILSYSKSIRHIGKYILQTRWIIAFFILMTSYLFFKKFAHTKMLIPTGLLAFTAVAQFAPALLLGIFWKYANKKGAICGIATGIIVWSFTIFFPYLQKHSEYFALLHIISFQIEGFSNEAFGTFLSLFLNTFAIVVVSLATKQDPIEEKLAYEIVHIFKREDYIYDNGTYKIDLTNKIPILKKNLGKLLSKDDVDTLIDKAMQEHGFKKEMTILEFQGFLNNIEKKLAGIVGSAVAHKLVINTYTYTEEEKLAISNLYKKIIYDINIPIEELRRKIDYFKERENLLKKHSEEQQKLIDAITEEQQKLNAVIESINDAIILCDDKGNIILKNNRLKKLININHKNNFNNIFSILSLFKDSKKLIDAYKLDKENIILETQLEDKYFEITFTKVEYEPSDQKWKIVVIRDITLSKLAEKHLITNEKFAALGVIAGGIAHDFNNQLTAIMGNLELCQKISDEKKKEKLIQKCIEIISRSKGLAQKLITFSKGGEPVKEKVLLQNILDEAISLSLAGSNIVVKKDIAPNIHAVYGDKEQLYQVFQNLIINAKEATEKGGTIYVTVQNRQISNHTQLKDGPYVEITIKDEGCGIPQDIILKIFDPYFTTKKHGTGLGLAICYSIIQKHNGLITVKSEPNKGTTFTILLPATLEKIEEKDIKRKDTTYHIIDANKKILILEDEEFIRDMIGEFLSMYGFEVVAVAKGEDAISIFLDAKSKNQPFDLVITDLTVPGGIGGEQLIKKLKEIDKNIKAIVMSGYSDDPIIANYKEYGFIDRLTKPFSLEILLEKITTILKN